MTTDDQSQPLDCENSSRHSVDQRRRESPPRPSKVARVIDDDDQEGGDDQRQQQTIAMSQNPNLQRYLVAIEYIGTRFCGAQQQLNARTVVGVLQEAFHKFIGQPVSIFCSSRTDAGVHAISNVCHVDVERVSKRKPDELLPPHEAAVVKRAVNHFLQKTEGDIMVTDVRCVAADFHSRYKAQERTYFYRILTGPEFLPTFEKDRAWHVPEELNISAMQKACQILVGCHDFSSFRATACQFLSENANVVQRVLVIFQDAKSPIRTLDELSVTEVVSTPYFPSVIERESQNMLGNDSSLCTESKVDQFYDSNQIKFEQSCFGSSQGFGIRRRHRCFVVTARARSFLYHQVRLLVGVLKAVGTGDLTLQDVERILNAKTVTAASPMAPACGLYLGHVKYDLP